MSLYPAQKPFKTLGQLVTKSSNYLGARGSDEMPRTEFKNLMESTGAAGGFLVQPELRPPVGLRGLPALVELLPQVPVKSNLVRVPVEDAGQSVADTVPEGELKPERDTLWSLGEFITYTIAEWIPASRQILEDSPLLQSYIDRQLKREVIDRLGELVIKGTGVDEIRGILNTVGIQTRTHRVESNGMGAATDSAWQTLSYASADIRLAGFNPDLWVLSPHLLAELDPAAIAAAGVLGISIVSDIHLAPGEAIVMDSQFSAIFIRDEATILIGRPHDFFLRNMVAILAEIRAAFGVTMPSSVVKVSFP